MITAPLTAAERELEALVAAGYDTPKKLYLPLRGISKGTASKRLLRGVARGYLVVVDPCAHTHNRRYAVNPARLAMGPLNQLLVRAAKGNAHVE